MKEIKKSINKYKYFPHKSGFPFKSIKELPKLSSNSKFNSLSGIKNIDWITTGETSTLASRHCGAVAATNTFLYMNNFYKGGKEDFEKKEIFKSLHKMIGNGPIFSIDSYLKGFFKKLGYDLKSKKIKSIDQYKSEIDKGNVIAILIARGIVQWHWVLGVGYIEYEDGNFYAQIIDGWHNSCDKFYKIKNNKSWLSARSFYI